MVESFLDIIIQTFGRENLLGLVSILRNYKVYLNLCNKEKLICIPNLDRDFKAQNMVTMG